MGYLRRFSRKNLSCANLKITTNIMSSSDEVRKLREEISRLRTENMEIKGVQYSINDKGQLVARMGNYECRLYKNQWKRIIASISELKAFMNEHESDLA